MKAADKLRISAFSIAEQALSQTKTSPEIADTISELLTKLNTIDDGNHSDKEKVEEQSVSTCNVLSSISLSKIASALYLNLHEDNQLSDPTILKIIEMTKLLASF